MVYQPRTYRARHAENDLFHFQVTLAETDLDIAIEKDRYSERLRQGVLGVITDERQCLEDYLHRDPVFKETLDPYEIMVRAPESAQEMCRAAQLAGVGPMAAVAGLFSERTGMWLSRYSSNIIVENGGDIWMKTNRIRRVAVYAGNSPFSYQIGLEIHPKQSPLGICTSSGTVGHSLSLGQADAAIVLAPSAILADAVATAMGNRIQTVGDLQKAVDFALSIAGVKGALAIKGDKLAVRGAVKLVPLD